MISTIVFSSVGLIAYIMGAGLAKRYFRHRHDSRHGESHRFTTGNGYPSICYGYDAEYKDRCNVSDIYRVFGWLWPITLPFYLFIGPVLYYLILFPLGRIYTISSGNVVKQLEGDK